MAVAAGLFSYQAWPYLRSHRIPNNDVRAAVRYLSTAKGPADVVFVSTLAGYGYAYYSAEKGLRFGLADYPGLAVDFRACYPDSTGVVLATGRSTDDLRRDWQHALKLAAQRRAARIWVFGRHVPRPETRPLPRLSAGCSSRWRSRTSIQVACLRASCLRGLPAAADGGPTTG